MALWIWWLSNTRKFLFEAGKLVKHVDIDKYTYSVYNIVFHGHETSSVANGFGKNAILIGTDEFFCTSW